MCLVLVHHESHVCIRNSWVGLSKWIHVMMKYKFWELHRQERLRQGFKFYFQLQGWLPHMCCIVFHSDSQCKLCVSLKVCKNSRLLWVFLIVRQDKRTFGQQQ